MHERATAEQLLVAVGPSTQLPQSLVLPSRRLVLRYSARRDLLAPPQLTM